VVKLHAIVVGIDRYASKVIRPLQWARADAEELARMLEGGFHPSQRDVRLLLDEDATKRAVTAEIGDRLARAASDGDLVLLYFACHGSPEIERDGQPISRYLVLHDTDPDQLFASGVDLEDDLLAMLRRIAGPRWVLVLIDACFSGIGGGRTFEGPRYRRSRSLNRDIRIPMSLNEMQLGEGRIILTACDDNQVAREHKELRHGVFTYHLLESLRRARPTATVSILQLHEEVRAAVLEASDGAQRPILNGRDAGLSLPSFP
jgi:uncharacterized caspase-like protein